MYRNVKAELVRKDMHMIDLAEKTGIGYQSLTLKLSGKSKLTLGEAKAIKKALDTDMTIEELFETAEAV